MEIILYAIVIIVVLTLYFCLKKYKNRVSEFVENDTETHNQIETTQYTNNVVYVSKDDDENELTSFALALKEAKEAKERLENEDKIKKIKGVKL